MPSGEDTACSPRLSLVQTIASTSPAFLGPDLAPVTSTSAGNGALGTCPRSSISGQATDYCAGVQRTGNCDTEMMTDVAR